MTGEKLTFYRRVLPDVCIAFASERGKQLFKNALSTEYMNCYFPLASQFRTQDEPAYCGLSSLVMVLNALAVDPGHVWKGVFRWYHEEMLDCCTSLAEVKEKGISNNSLMCLALCNQLNGEFKRVTNKACIAEFREELKFSTKRDDRAIIISYGRQVLGQTGTGHFSPVGGYNELEDMVLILDVARFKYPPYWVSVKKLWDAMNTKEVDTGLPRGYMVLWRADNPVAPSQPPLLFKISQRLNASHSIVKESGALLAKIESFLSQKAPDSTDTALKGIIKMLLAESFKDSQNNAQSSFLTIRVTFNQLASDFTGELEAIEQMIQAIEDTYICQKIGEMFPNGLCCRQALFSTPDDLPINNENICCVGPNNNCKICLKHFLTVFILSFPMEVRHTCSNQETTDTSRSTPHFRTYRDVLHDVVEEELSCDSCTKHAESVSPKLRRALLLNEVNQLRKQFNVLMKACQ